MCHRSLWRPKVSPSTLKGPPLTSPDPPRGDSDVPSKNRKETHDDAMTSFFHLFCHFCVGPARPPTRKSNKNQGFLTIFKLHCRSPSITFFPFGSQKCPSRTPFGQHRAPSWALWPPLEILKGHDRGTQRDRNFQKACHSSSICPKRALRANMKKLNFT